MHQPLSYPQITELPKLLDASGWIWQSISDDHPMRVDREWWIGTDPYGQKWLVKMRGSFLAYREHVFSSLAQRLGISCQSSAYVIIPTGAAPLANARAVESCELALWFMVEHERMPCSAGCPLAGIYGRTLDLPTIESARVSGVSQFEDLVRGDVLGALCGQFEPHGHFFTRDHDYVVIDNELMFAGPPNLKACRWSESAAARPLVTDVCRRLLGMGESDLREIATTPRGFAVLNGHDLTGNLKAAQKEAAEFLDLFG